MKRMTPEDVEKLLREFADDLSGLLEAYSDPVTSDREGVAGLTIDLPWKSRADYVLRAIERYFLQSRRHKAKPEKYDAPDIGKTLGLVRDRQGKPSKEEMKKSDISNREDQGRRVHKLKKKRMSWEKIAELENADKRTVQRVHATYLADLRRQVRHVSAGLTRNSRKIRAQKVAAAVKSLEPSSGK
jgi:hypothetical protein